MWRFSAHVRGVSLESLCVCAAAAVVGGEAKTAFRFFLSAACAQAVVKRVASGREAVREAAIGLLEGGSRAQIACAASLLRRATANPATNAAVLLGAAARNTGDARAAALAVCEAFGARKRALAPLLCVAAGTGRVDVLDAVWAHSPGREREAFSRGERGEAEFEAAVESAAGDGECVSCMRWMRARGWRWGLGALERAEGRASPAVWSWLVNPVTGGGRCPGWRASVQRLLDEGQVTEEGVDSALAGFSLRAWSARKAGDRGKRERLILQPQRAALRRPGASPFG